MRLRRCVHTPHPLVHSQTCVRVCVRRTCVLMSLLLLHQLLISMHCVCVCMCVRVYACVRVCVRVRAIACPSVNLPVEVCVPVCMYVCLSQGVCVCVCVCVRACVCMYLYHLSPPRCLVWEGRSCLLSLAQGCWQVRCRHKGIEPGTFYSVLVYICITQSDWPTDPSLLEKVEKFELFDARPRSRQNGRTHNAFGERPVQSQQDPPRDGGSVNQASERRAR